MNPARFLLLANFWMID